MPAAPIASAKCGAVGTGSGHRRSGISPPRATARWCRPGRPSRATSRSSRRLPPDILEEATLVTNGFSARYGQALSGLINVVTKDGGDRWRGRAAYETDRPAPDGWDYGLDRAVAEADGPLGRGIRLLAVLDATGRLDADPVNAPAPLDARDPRRARPWLLPHNSGETYDAAGKLTVPIGSAETR